MNPDISIDKIRKLSFAIIHSTTIALPAWHKACTTNSCPICLIPHDVKTCWNSMYNMLTVAFDYCTVINDITANKSLKLRCYELDDQDWEVVVDLLRVLKVCFFCHVNVQFNLWCHQMYKDVILFFSQDNAVTIANVVPTMDHINKMLSASAARLLNSAVKHTLTFARKLMDKYYSKTNLSNVYHIAMGS
jgi:hypothetical protein